MSKHTPGPWETSRDAVQEGHVQITVYSESDGERVATVFQCEANARLIAAAPDLLAALERSLNWLASYPGGGTLSRTGPLNQAHQAIAKAKGEE